MDGFAIGAPQGITGGGTEAQGGDWQGYDKGDANVTTAGQLNSQQTDGEGGVESKAPDSNNTTGNEDAGNNTSVQTYGNGATMMSVHNSPDFMLLPLELQGFCPWTVVHAKGLLIPGKPNLGVVRYDNMYFVCDHDTAAHAFMKNPDYCLNQIRHRALHHPEYIHLLRLQRWFPSTSIARLLEQNDFDPRAVGGMPATRDAST